MIKEYFINTTLYLKNKLKHNNSYKYSKRNNILLGIMLITISIIFLIGIIKQQQITKQQAQVNTALSSADSPCISPTSITTQTPTSQPTEFSTPTPTPTLGPPIGNISLHFEGIDSSNNLLPKHAQRKITLSFFNTNNFFSSPVATIDTLVTFVRGDSSGSFVNPYIDLSEISSGSYYVLVKSTEGSLQELLNSGQQITVAPGKTIFLGQQANSSSPNPINLRMGDLNNDNSVDIKDYNIFVDCFENKQKSVSCTRHGLNDTVKGLYADLNDDGIVDGVDYNILVRHFGENGFGQVNTVKTPISNFITDPCLSPSPTNIPSTSTPTLPVQSPTLTSGITPSPTSVSPSPVSSGQKLFGVNISGGDFAPPQYAGTGYNGYSYYHGKGLTLIRLPFTWESMEPTLGGPIGGDINRLTDMINAAQSAGETVFIEPHNYARYHQTPLTSNDSQAFANFWKQMAQKYATGFPGLFGYELMNEPHDLSGGCQTWQTLAQAGLNAIRSVDTAHYVIVPGYFYQQARLWPSQSGCLLTIQDPANKLIFSAHEYFDSDFSGLNYSTTPCTDVQRGVTAVQPFLTWLNQNNKLGMLTEFGVPIDSCWLSTLDNFYKALNTSPNIIGATYWSAGPFWNGYNLSVEPSNGQDRPQMSILQKYPSR